MSYRISYHRELERRNVGDRIQVPIVVLLLILSLINGIYYISGNLSDLREKLMPWTQPQVQSAYMQLRDDIAEGRPIGESVGVFCLEILENDVQQTKEKD